MKFPTTGLGATGNTAVSDPEESDDCGRGGIIARPITLWVVRTYTGVAAGMIGDPGGRLHPLPTTWAYERIGCDVVRDAVGPG